MARFIHTADLHFGKGKTNDKEDDTRYHDHFRCFRHIVNIAIKEKVDFFLIAGDLFHFEDISPDVFTDTIKALSPLKDAGIPCVAVEGNHDWVHRRKNLTWIESLAELGYLLLLRPTIRDKESIQFAAYDSLRKEGGKINIHGINLYGAGYLGPQPQNFLNAIIKEVNTKNNILLLHTGVWNSLPHEIIVMNPEESYPLASKFNYVALGHGHDPYIIKSPEGRAFAFNPGAPETVAFSEKTEKKGFYLVEMGSKGKIDYRHLSSNPRPAIKISVKLSPQNRTDEAMREFKEQLRQQSQKQQDLANASIEIKLTGKVYFNPLLIDKNEILTQVAEIFSSAYLEIKNQVSQVQEGDSFQNQAPIPIQLFSLEQDNLKKIFNQKKSSFCSSEQFAEIAMILKNKSSRADTSLEELIQLLDTYI